jgi:Arc/MetJ-type ribon-helix-helix transcriptional regulator
MMNSEEAQMNTKSSDNNPKNSAPDQPSPDREKNVFEEFGDQVEKFANRTVESLKKTIDRALISRNTVLTIRVNNDANRKLNTLVEAGLFRSRSESAAFLIEEGIKHQDTLFQKISLKMDKIEKLKEELSDIISKEMSIPEKDQSKTAKK